MRKSTTALALVFALLLAVPSPAFAISVGADCGYGESAGVFHTRGTSSNYQNHVHQGVKRTFYPSGVQTFTVGWGQRVGYNTATLTGTYITGYAFCPS